MRKIFKILLYIFTFFFAIFLFLPKESIYFYIEKNLLENKIIVSNETVKENTFGFDILDAQIYYENINIAAIEEMKIESYFLYSKAKVTNVKLLDSFQAMIPSPINDIELSHSILSFSKINIVSSGLFGELSGFIDILNRTVFLELEASSNMKNSYSKLLRNMKLEEGKYYYEYKF